MRFRATFVFEYEVEGDWADAYGTTDPTKMAAIDEASFRDDPGNFLSMMGDDEATIKVEPLAFSVGGEVDVEEATG